MKDHNAQCLRALVEANQKLSDATKAELLADLRAEAFWNERAPDLNDELLALRPLEKFARLAAAPGGVVSSDQGKELVAALKHLDGVRQQQAKRRTTA